MGKNLNNNDDVTKSFLDVAKNYLAVSLCCVDEWLPHWNTQVNSDDRQNVSEMKDNFRNLLSLPGVLLIMIKNHTTLKYFKVKQHFIKQRALKGFYQSCY